jgi:biopolymer transport protein ExbD
MLFSKPQRRRQTHINLISLIDVFLFLVIFYMLTAHWLKNSSLPLSLAENKASKVTEEKPSAEKNGFILQLLANQRVKINENEIIAQKDLAQYLSKQQPISWIRIQLNPDTNIQELADILALAKNFSVEDTTLEREILAP